MQNTLTFPGFFKFLAVIVAGLVMALLLVKPGITGTHAGSPDCRVIEETNFDDCIRMNHLQFVGTHNSYKLAPHPELIRVAKKQFPEAAGRFDRISYEHRPLTEQLEDLGIRQFELDIFADPEGGRFAEPFGALVSGDHPFIRPQEMMQPGFKVLHVQDIDYRSHCLTFKACLQEIRDWSDRNPYHLPIMVLVELKDGTPSGFNGFTFTEAITIDEELIFDVDKEIASIFPEDRIIRPDDVRGQHTTLDEAIRRSGWPSLRESRGKVLFALDNEGRHRDAYLSRSPILENRIMFVSSPPGEPSAAFIKMNNPLRDRELIRNRIIDGYLIRTRSDSPGREARLGDTTRQLAAKYTGAQYVSTDYPETSPYVTQYIMKFPDTDRLFRCNPVSAPEGCRNKWLVE